MGSTGWISPASHDMKDHPHIHGEHPDPTDEPWEAMGSPPYTWGAPDSLHFVILLFGITPIYMGST